MITATALFISLAISSELFMFYNHVLMKSCPNYCVSRVKDVEHFDWFFLLNVKKFVFCIFQ